MTARFHLSLLTLSLLIGCARVPVATEGQVLNIIVDGNKCFASVNGEKFLLGNQDKDLVSALRQSAVAKDRISISANMETPYRCVGPAVAVLHMAGFTGVGFVAEPPSK